MELFSSVDTIWVLLGAVLVFWMQAGFAMVETGFTRAKNAANIIMKNLMDFAIGSILFWIIGFGIMFGPDIAGLIGGGDFFIQGNYDSTFPTAAFIIFQTVFCATAATIVSGAMAERTKFISYIIYSAVISAIIYPISGHWIWGDGWLSQLGFHDFAGSTAVHMVGGISALVGAKILGPRIGKYTKDGKSKAIPGHSLTLGALGVFILWMAWFGFNGGSTVSMTGDESILSASNIFVTTNMAAAAATITVMIITWVKYKKPDVSMTLNGSLAGLVAVTAGCDMVSPTGAFFIGIIAGGVLVFAVEFIDKKLKIDDPVGASAVHGVCGAIGTVLVGLFALDGGLFYGGGASFLLTQLTGVGAVALYVAVAMFVVFKIIDATIGLRVPAQEELAGLDVTEHGMVSSYADFMPTSALYSSDYEVSELSDKVREDIAAVNMSRELEALQNSENSVGQAATGTDGRNVFGSKVAAAVGNSSKVTAFESQKDKLTKLSIVINKDKFNLLKKALNEIGVTGITVTNVLGCGMQKGSENYYRGAEMEVMLLPKLKVEIVVAKVPVDKVIETAVDVLNTGNIGDGKIFVYDVENVIKVRTGEEGYDALQDECLEKASNE